jgi:hypothetical protein
LYSLQLASQMNAKQRWRIAYRLGRVCQGPLTDIPYGLKRQVEVAIRGAEAYPPMAGRILGKLRSKREQAHWREYYGVWPPLNCRCVVAPITELSEKDN